MPQLYQDELLERQLRALLGDLEPAAMDLLRQQLEWVAIAGGQTLMSQGEPGDSMYLVISGRLRAYVRDADEAEHMLREMGRGQIIGEMSLYTDEPRSASVVAIRDSVLVRLDKPAFNELLAKSAQVSVMLTRQLILRLQHPQQRSELARPVTIGLLPITDGVDAVAFGGQLAQHLARHGRVCIVDGERLDRELGQAGLSSSGDDDLEANRRLAVHLDEIEAAHDFVLLIGDDQPNAWTQRCSRRSDELLLLADATRPPRLHTTEQALLVGRPGRAEASETLVLLHPADTRCPSGTREWLARRPVAGHVHLRSGLERDLARLARLLNGSAVGLVLAGGGARGLAHLGVWRALREQGVEIDVVGGTSIGAIMAALIASDRPVDEAIEVARRSFKVNPTGDFNWLPLLSLIAGRRLKRLISTAVHEVFGFDADVEDLWKTFYCVASNYSQAREQQLTHGRLEKALRASIAIPGALPPVLHEGDLLCDGGTFNNFPVDLMRATRGVGKVIGVDLGLRRSRPIEHDEVPGTWTLLRDRLRPRARRHYKLPSLVAYLMNVTILYSSSRQRQAQRLTDLHINPPLARVGMLQWQRFDSIVEQGHAHGRELLAGMDTQALAPYRAA